MVSEDRIITRQAAADALDITVRTVYRKWPRGVPLRESDLPRLASLIKEKPELRERRRQVSLRWWAERKAELSKRADGRPSDSVAGCER